MDYKNKYDEYLEKLLLLQYEASNIFEHKLTKGEIREEFIKQIVLSQFNDAKLYRGSLISGTYQSPQIDLILVSQSSSSRIRSLGANTLIDVKDAKLIVEIKSVAKTSELRELNELADEIKKLDDYQDTKIGMFMYDYQIKKESMLKKFGYKYDAEIDTFVDDAPIEFSNIDFVVSLDPRAESSVSNNGFFLIKDSNTNRYILLFSPPYSKYFFNLFGI